MNSSPSNINPALEKACIDAIRVLSMDAVQKANSGHPGTPMALAPLAYRLYTKHMRYNPLNPNWADRDRFVLSCGHASMLIYSALYLSGFDLSLDDIKAFRQWNSKTPGHPEYGHTPGVETTTGPLGQGIGNAIGMAVAEAHLAATFNKEGHNIVDHYTWFICSDGDIMEGVSHEAASHAGHLKLGKLIGFYDDNNITIEGECDLTFSDNTAQRFEAYGWHVQTVADINDLDAIDAAIEVAKAVKDKPSFIVVKSHIGYGSPNKQDTADAHGAPLGDAEIKLTKEALGIESLEPFYVNPDALKFWREAQDRGKAAEAEWNTRFAKYSSENAELAAEFERRDSGKLKSGWDKDIPVFTAANGSIASRAASGVVLNAIAPHVPELIGGSADLASSTNTIIKGAPSFNPGQYDGRNFHYGIREHGMGSIMNGMSLHGGVIPYGATFLIFSDYMRPTIRLAALMNQRVIYVFTHDSIGLGEDGPTHQPIEQVTTLRAIPNVLLLRPADASETAEAWRAALNHTGGPVILVLTRQKLAFIDRDKHGPAGAVSKGAYILSEAEGGSPEVVLLSSGSEVDIVLKAQKQLQADGVRARVVSVPSMELFAKQDQNYKDSVLPIGVKRVSIEAGSPMSWHNIIGNDGVALGLERFGASAPFEELYSQFGLTVENVVNTAKSVISK